MRRNSPFNMLRSPVKHRKDGSGYNNLFGGEELDDVTPLKKIECLEREVRPKDTLLSISLEYNVSVSELKRVNNILNDNEIHARNHVKIPLRPFSLLLESKFFENDNDEAADVSTPLVRHMDKAQKEAAELVELVNNATVAEAIPMTPLLSSEASPTQDYDETEILLRAGPEEPDTTTPLACQFADGDLTWGFLLMIVICIGIGGPIIYMWYFWNHLDKTS